MCSPTTSPALVAGPSNPEEVTDMTTSSGAQATAIAEAEFTNARKAIVAASFGTYVEYYDFVVYGYVAAYIAAAYFPSEDPFVGLLLTFGAFAASYVARPLGAVIFAPLGDKYGRKRILAVVILLMTMATAAIGLLPTYAQIGMTAPVLLTLLRVLQGISAGGEYGGAISLIGEFAPPRKRGFYIGFIALTTGLALLSGSAFALMLTRALSESSMQSWGWRIPLLLSLPLGLIGLYIRFKLEETPHFTALARKEMVDASPLVTTLKRDRRTVLVAVGIAAANACLLSVYFVYMPSALKQFSHFAPADAQLVIFAGLVAYCISVLPFAKLADRVGRRPVLLASSIALAVLVYPSFVLLSRGVLLAAVIAMVVIAPAIAANVAATLPMLTEMFSTANRYTGLSLGWQVATTIFSGPTPLVLAALAGTGGATQPALYVIAVLIVSIVAGFATKETFNRPLR